MTFVVISLRISFDEINNNLAKVMLLLNYECNKHCLPQFAFILPSVLYIYLRSKTPTWKSLKKCITFTLYYLHFPFTATNYNFNCLRISSNCIVYKHLIANLTSFNSRLFFQPLLFLFVLLLVLLYIVVFVVSGKTIQFSTATTSRVVGSRIKSFHCFNEQL